MNDNNKFKKFFGFGENNDAQESSEGDNAPAMTDKEALEKAEAHIGEWAEKYLTLTADFENYKKHAIKERSDLLKYGAEKALIEVLGVLDNFERAMQTGPTAENLDQYVKGIDLTVNELRAVLGRFGVAEVPSLGQNFDPVVHEALSSEETSEYEPGQICRVFKKPYKMHDKLIRPGQVVVAKKAGS